MVKLRAVFLLGTLKTSAETSNTHILSEFLANHFKSYGTESEIIRLADYNIKPGVYTNIDSDDWSAIFEKILDADIVIFAKLADAAKTKVMRILTPNFNFDDGIQRESSSRLLLILYLVKKFLYFQIYEQTVE